MTNDSVKIPTGIFGGSFDPPHFGHAGILRSFFREFPDCKEVFLVPNLQNPLKGEKTSSPEAILEMLQLFVSEFEENVTILDLELKREGPSYTVRTLEELGSSYPEREFYLLIGEDNYSNFHEWKDWKKILGSVKTVCVFRRTSETIPENPELGEVSSKFTFLNNPLLPVSSTELRREFGISRENRGVPANLRNYIEKKGLYRT
ncbi:nicotinate (nicotinamide) nucleotide adenylyltransferase [Leptospira gomenensis]|uniref:Probable nicotinate-nucleotide adenylyltransferase n=1 Tax=Leptospira gomenensis TaxID=2484974 RepID=A0A5F1Z4N1_9LEPT|nr:nicotinate (nicotinamide) nucleotide adenylyltransferase [Leptospira gomenensis]TGK28937.1 nicotinate (nicotinamide) nucleotide adenylyltransferase [Leptospira gomenensis]TGK40696.1 nicotinate (nicotinamide) nucleotide adenylyltransferase [Leptospira gomenensis]TGK42517.1 nicotinate (nicotinamide) nucleotide adenylyltransferase [Leptospira gomenensis]TGK68460.1 nicotinate (nicotinamide) nucleotide adenylyltransferase [Leptospira gomenensis]